MKGKVFKFLLLILASTVATYFLPGFVATGLYLLLLVLYFRSDDEAFWLAFFLAISDGFLGFFGNYEAVLNVIPGLPPVEVGQFYIGLALIKAMRRAPNPPFYQGWLLALLIYCGFLALQGQAAGLSTALNVQFRVLKMLLPLTLFFTVPRLLREEEDYRTFFKYVFIMGFTAVIAQCISLFTGFSPAQFVGAATDSNHLLVDVTEGLTYRGFYSPGLLLMSTLGAIVLLTRPSARFTPTYLYIVLASNFTAVFLSATRGWTLAMLLIFLGFALFVARVRAIQMVKMSFVVLVLVIALVNLPVIGIQVQNAIERMGTLEALAEGDVTAGGTLRRLDERSPRVVNKWLESPLTGWGFSNEFFRFRDPHVGNQNVLMHAGVVGYLLMIGFFFYFHSRLVMRNYSLAPQNPYRRVLMAFPVFFAGYFLIHSTSSQQFSFYLSPAYGMMQAAFFSMGAMYFRLGAEARERLAEERAERQEKLRKVYAV